MITPRSSQERIDRLQMTHPAQKSGTPRTTLGWTEVLTTAQMRAVEQDAIGSGMVSGIDLMEAAGAAVACHIRRRWPKPGRATVLCGPGNNGGDGYVVAALLAGAGWQVRVLGTDNTPGPDAAEMKRRWEALGPIGPLTRAGLRSGPGSDLYVDAIFGTGSTRPPEGEIADVLAHMRGRNGDTMYYAPRTVAIDSPSGLCLDSGRILGASGAGEFVAPVRLTVAFQRPKPGHLLSFGPELCGELVIADIGLEPWVRMKAPRPSSRGMIGPIRSPRLARIGPEGQDDGRGLLRISVAHLDKSSGHGVHNTIGNGRHKFTHGHALILAGGLGHGGAARLTARAALRVGAGLVTLAPPKSALIEHSGQPDALMRRGVDDAGALAALLDDRRITAVALGPGCGVDRAGALLDAVLGSARACVLDADALTALAGQGTDGLHEHCVLTPHEGEFARLFPDLAERLNGPVDPGLPRYADAARPDFMQHMADFDARAQAVRRALADQRGPLYSKLAAAREAAARCGAVVLLKGPDTVIAAPDGQARIHSAYDVPWLATAGSGDVLAGIIAGLLARGMQPLDAAATGAFLHAQAARRIGPGLIADDLPDQLPAVFRDLGL